MRYLTTREIIIPAGTEITVEPPQTREYHTAVASVVVDYAEECPSSLEMIVDLDDALEAGFLIKEEGPTDAEVEAEAKTKAKTKAKK